MKQYFKQTAAFVLCMAMLMGLFAGAVTTVRAEETATPAATPTAVATWSEDFEDKTVDTDLAAALWSNAIGTWSVSADKSNGGSYSLKLSATDNANNQAYLYTPAIPVEGLDYIYAQYDVNTAAPTNLMVRLLDVRGNQIAQYSAGGIGNTSGNWSTRSVLADIKADVEAKPAAKYAVILVYVNNVTDVAYFDNFVIRGLKTTDHTYTSYDFNDAASKTDLAANGWSYKNGNFAGAAMPFEAVDGALKITTDGYSTGAFYSPYIPVTPGQSITISADIKANGNVYLDGCYYDADMVFASYIGTNNKISATNPTGEWTSYSKTMTVPEGVAYLNLMPYITGNIGDVYFDNITVKATVPTKGMAIVDSLNYDFGDITAVADIWADGFTRAGSMAAEDADSRMTKAQCSPVDMRWAIKFGDANIDGAHKPFGFNTPAVEVAGAEKVTVDMDYCRFAGGMQVYAYFLDANGAFVKTDAGKDFHSFTNLNAGGYAAQNYTLELDVPENAVYFYVMLNRVNEGVYYVFDINIATCIHVAGAAATCTTAQTCTLCGEVLAPATGHTANIAFADCVTAKACSVCETVIDAACGHYWDDDADEPQGICYYCNATNPDFTPDTPAGVVLDENLTIPTKAIDLGAAIGGQFMINQAAITAGGYTNAYIVVSQNGEEITLRDNLMDPSQGYVFRHTMKAAWMGLEITVTAYAEKDGVIYKGNPETWSIKQGALDRLNLYYPHAVDGNAYMKRCVLIVDMLYYGAEAQAVFAKDTTPVTEGLAAEYVALRTTTEPTISFENTAALKAVNGLFQYNLGLEAKVNMQFTFYLPDANYENYTIKVTNKDGVVKEFTGDDFIVPVESVPQLVTAVYDELGALYMRDTVEVELYQNGKLISDTYTASIEGCAKINVDKGSNVDLVKAMMKYGDSAKASLG